MNIWIWVDKTALHRTLGTPTAAASAGLVKKSWYVYTNTNLSYRTLTPEYNDIILLIFIGLSYIFRHIALISYPPSLSLWSNCCGLVNHLRVWPQLRPSAPSSSAHMCVTKGNDDYDDDDDIQQYAISTLFASQHHKFSYRCRRRRRRHYCHYTTDESLSFHHP